MSTLIRIVVCFLFAGLCLPAKSQELIRFQDAEDYFIHFDPVVNLNFLDAEIAQRPNAVNLLIQRARLRLMYGMDTEAAEDMSRIEAINPYALYLHGFYGSDGYMRLLEQQPMSAVTELDLVQRMYYYDEYIDEQHKLGNITASDRTTLHEIVEQIAAGEFVPAMNALEEFVETHAEDALGYDLLSIIHAELEDYELATEALSDAIALEPNYAMAWYNFGRIERLNGRYGYAKEYFDEAIELRAELSKAYFDRALVNKQLANLDQAEEDYARVIKNDTLLRETAQWNRGLARKMSGDFQGALDDLNAAITQYPDSAPLYKNRGNLFLLLGQLEDAVDDYDEAISLDINFAEAYYNRGLALYISGKQNLACRDFDSAGRLGFERGKEKYELFCDLQYGTRN